MKSGELWRILTKPWQKQRSESASLWVVVFFFSFFSKLEMFLLWPELKCRAMVKPSEVAMLTFTHGMAMHEDRWLLEAAAQHRAKVNFKHS